MCVTDGCISCQIFKVLESFSDSLQERTKVCEDWPIAASNVPASARETHHFALNESLAECIHCR